MTLIPKGVKPRRMKDPDWKQPEYITYLKGLFPNCEIHHLIHNKVPNRRRKDDRLVFPLIPEQHRELHCKWGDELRYFNSIGVEDPYKLGDRAWEQWGRYGFEDDYAIVEIYSWR